MKNRLPVSPEMQPERRRLMLALAGSGALAACGGGGGDAGTADTPAQTQETLSHPLGVGAGGTGLRLNSLIVGPVAQIRPCAVGGVALNTSKAILTDGDGQALVESDIAVGMTARVLAGPITTAGGISTAQAQSLVVDTQLRGPAQRLDAHTLQVLAQRVTVNASTLYAPGVDPAALPADLRVWGDLDLSAGRVMATRIDRMAAGDSLMLRGLLAAVDAATGQLQIGALVARPANPAVVPAALRAGAVVRAVLGSRGADGVYELQSVRDDALRPPDNVTAELEGRVTLFDNAANFAVEGVTVDASAARVEGAAYLALGAAVEVSGTMRQGVLVAREVQAQAPEPVEFEGRVTACDNSQQLMTVGGLPLHWSASTVFTRGAPRDLRVGRSVAGLGYWGPGMLRLEVTRLQIET